jgi:inorganic pyrophosphatase/exopolyphosphatase
MTRIITSGWRYLDIDAYAGCIAYAELLRLQGIQAIALCSAPLNESVPTLVKDWPVEFVTDYNPGPNDDFSLVDISDPDEFDPAVSQAKIVEVIDHRPGFKDFWQKRLGQGAQIEHVGAACTQIAEKWSAAGWLEQMNPSTARLLACGILDNTLNFGATITTDRDRTAYQSLSKQLPDDLTEQYFNACQDEIMQDVAGAVSKDTKVLKFNSYTRKVTIGQLALWDAHGLLSNQAEQIRESLGSKTKDWFLNLISIQERSSTLYAESNQVQAWLQDLLKVKFEANTAVADRPWLRKEISGQDARRGKE